MGGSIAFIPSPLPLIQELPTMIVGISSNKREKRAAIVASLSKEMTNFYKHPFRFDSHDEYLRDLTSFFSEALSAF